MPLLHRPSSCRPRCVLCSRHACVTTFCGEGEDVVGVHSLLSGVVQVCHELLVGEDEEKEKEQGRQEEREVKGEGQSEENTHVDDHVDGMKGETQT